MGDVFYRFCPTESYFYNLLLWLFSCGFDRIDKTSEKQ